VSIRRERNNPPTRDPMDMAPGLGYRISSDRQPGIEQANMRRMPQYKPLPITPDYERPMPMPLPIPPNYERGPYKPMPFPPNYDRQLPTPPDYGTGPMPMPMPQPPFTPKEFDDYFNRRRGFNTSETARENFISRTDGGYPDRQDPSFMDKYGDYINRGLEYMPFPIGPGSRILRGLGSLYGGNAAEYIDELPVTPLQDDQAMQRPQSFTNLDMLGRPDLAFRYSNMDPGRTSYDLFDTPGNPSQDASIRGTYRRTQTGRTVADRDPRANEMDEYGYLEGAPRQRTTFSEGYMNPRSFDEMYGGVYDDAIFRTVDPNTNRIEQFPMAGGMEQAAVDPSDYRTILKMIEAGLDPNDYIAANRGGLMSLRR